MTEVTQAGGDLFRVAAAHLNDATQWNLIAALNALNDPVLSGVVTLQLPAINPTAGGGIVR